MNGYLPRFLLVEKCHLHYCFEDESIEMLKSRREQTIADVVAFRDKTLKGLDHTRALIEQSCKAIDDTLSTLRQFGGASWEW